MTRSQRAPDLALAEGAIGARLTGALLLDTPRRLDPEGAADEARPLRPTPSRAAGPLLIAGSLAGREPRR